MPKEADVVVVPYDAHWPTHFAKESGTLAEVLAPLPVLIEHIGSTAVPGLSAKPVIDIMLGVEHLNELEQRISTIERLGYLYVPEFESQMPERRFFRKPRTGERTHHLHAVERGTEFWNRHLAFRDLLRRDSKLLDDYANLKNRLAREFPNDRDRYTDSKSGFIAEALAKIRSEA